MVFEIINWNWEDIILKVHCFHCRNIKATIINSIQVYGWLTSSEYSNLSEIKLLILEWISSIRISECNSNPTNWSIVQNVFLNELVLSGRNGEKLCKSFQLVELEVQRSVSKHVHSFVLIIILKSNTTSVEWTINNSKNNVGVVANYVKTRSGSDQSLPNFDFWIQQFRKEKKSSPILT